MSENKTVGIPMEPELWRAIQRQGRTNGMTGAAFVRSTMMAVLRNAGAILDGPADSTPVPVVTIKQDGSK